MVGDTLGEEVLLEQKKFWYDSTYCESESACVLQIRQSDLDDMSYEGAFLGKGGGHGLREDFLKLL